MCEKNWLPFHVEYPIGQEEEENENPFAALASLKGKL